MEKYPLREGQVLAAVFHSSIVEKVNGFAMKLLQPRESLEDQLCIYTLGVHSAPQLGLLLWYLGAAGDRWPSAFTAAVTGSGLVPQRSEPSETSNWSFSRWKREISDFNAKIASFFFLVSP